MKDILLETMAVIWILGGVAYVWAFKPWKTLAFLFCNFFIVTMTLTNGNILGSLLSAVIFSFASILPTHKALMSIHQLLFPRSNHSV